MSGSGPLVLLLGAAAGGLAAVAAREAVLATPAVARWVSGALEPLRRAGREGYAPSPEERLRLAGLGTLGLLLGGALVLGPGPAPFLALAGPAVAAAALRRRRARYRRAVDRGLAELALAIADGLSGGRAVRVALADAAGAVEGAMGVEMARVRADLDLGRPTREALAGFRARLRSGRADALCAALASQQLAGGDLGGLLRRFAAAASARDRTASDARSATAQARFTGLLVAAMPAGAALFAELLQPGFLTGMLSDPASAALLALAGGLQAGGFAAISRLARVAGP